MKLADCEVSHRVIRGTVTVALFGSRRLAADELADLRAQYEATHGPGVVPAYVSPDGWQVMEDTETGPLASRFEFDEAREVVFVDGKAIAGAMFDGLASPTPSGTWFRVVNAEGETVTVESRTEADIVAGAAGSAIQAAAPVPATPAAKKARGG